MPESEVGGNGWESYFGRGMNALASQLAPRLPERNISEKEERSSTSPILCSMLTILSFTPGAGSPTLAPPDG